MTQTASATSNLGLAIWPRTPDQHDREPQFSPFSRPGALLAQFARRTIETYTDPGDLVVDLMCGDGTTLVEAILLDRDAIGSEFDRRAAKRASANIDRARSQGAPGRARVLTGSPRDLPRALTRREAQELLDPADPEVKRLPRALADLVLSVLPAGEPCVALDAYAAIAAGTVKPGGFVVSVIGNHQAGTTVAGEVVEYCQQMGLDYWQHVLGLLAPIRDGQLAPGPELRKRSHAGLRRAEVVCHEDILVFRRPDAEQPTETGGRR